VTAAPIEPSAKYRDDLQHVLRQVLFKCGVFPLVQDDDLDCLCLADGKDQFGPEAQEPSCLFTVTGFFGSKGESESRGRWNSGEIRRKIWSLISLSGAEGGTRTRTTFRSLDPETNLMPFLLLDVFLQYFILKDLMMSHFVLLSSILFSHWSKIGAKE